MQLELRIFGSEVRPQKLVPTLAGGNFWFHYRASVHPHTRKATANQGTSESLSFIEASGRQVLVHDARSQSHEATDTTEFSSSQRELQFWILLKSIHMK